MEKVWISEGCNKGGKVLFSDHVMKHFQSFQLMQLIRWPYQAHDQWKQKSQLVFAHIRDFGFKCHHMHIASFVFRSKKNVLVQSGSLLLFTLYSCFQQLHNQMLLFRCTVLEPYIEAQRFPAYNYILSPAHYFYTHANRCADVELECSKHMNNYLVSYTHSI